MAKKCAKSKKSGHDPLNARLYGCRISREVVERELAATCLMREGATGEAVTLYEVPEGVQAWVTDFSWGATDGEGPSQVVLGRLTTRGQFHPVVYLAEGGCFSPSRPVRFLPGEGIALAASEWLLAAPDASAGLDVAVNVAARFTEEPAQGKTKGSVKRQA